MRIRKREDLSETPASMLFQTPADGSQSVGRRGKGQLCSERRGKGDIHRNEGLAFVEFESKLKVAVLKSLNCGPDFIKSAKSRH